MRKILISVLFFPVACVAQDDSVSKMDQCRQLATAVANEGTGVYRAALCFESIHDLVDAANAYRRAGDLQFEPGTAIVRLASIFLLTGQYERALNEVQATIQAQRAAAQDCTSPEYHQLDFLAGEWGVQSEGRNIGTSKIKPVLHNCALLEDLTTREGTVSFMFYDSVSPGWLQKGAAQDGKVGFELSGQFSDGVMHFSGTTSTLSEPPMRQRMEWTPFLRQPVNP